MTLDPILNAPFAIQLHVCAAIPATVLGPLAIYRSKRDLLHKCTGYAWISAMAVMALSSFFISGWRVIGPFGPIHLISIFVLQGLISGLSDARAARIAAHKATMQSIYWWGIGLAGLLTLMPGRRLNDALFGTHPETGYLVVAAGLLLLTARWWSARQGGWLSV
ncbi:DUF2306 domain-containing protein [Ruegeria hyattellae]|uniref:DUF2306 domain-containing protein n=1 Tax=Ruegeria hyattellae TaxID=3233337 RepID=UPI00355C83C2